MRKAMALAGLGLAALTAGCGQGSPYPTYGYGSGYPGYAYNAGLGSDALRPGMEVLSKPFTTQSLVFRVQEMLDRA